MVLKSTKNSVINKEVSLLAIFEIIASIAFYWYISYKFDTYTHIVVSIIISPLLLLRSEKSKQHALDLFSRLLNAPNIDNTIISHYIMSIFSIIISIFLTSIIFPYFEVFTQTTFSLIIFGFTLGIIYSGIALMIGIFFRYSVNPIRKSDLFFIVNPTLGISIYSVFFVNNNEYGVMSFGASSSFLFVLLSLLAVKKTGTSPSLAMAGGGVGLAFVAIWYKFLSIVGNLKDGIANFSGNWKENNFVIDISQIPEVMYGVEDDTRFNNDIKLSYLLNRKYINNVSVFDILMYIVYYSFYYFIALFYRISIKSTFWFYFPLLFLVKLPDDVLENRADKGSFLDSLHKTEFAKGTSVISGFIFLVFILQYIFKFGSLETINTIKGILQVNLEIILRYIDCRILNLWCLLLVSISILTVVIYFYANKLKVEKHDHNIDFKIEPIFYMYLVRRWIVYLLFLVGIIYFVNDFKIYDYSYIPAVFKDLFIKLWNLIDNVKF